MVLAKETAILEDMIRHSEKSASGVSEKGIDWHLAHSLKVIIGVCKSLKKSDPKSYQWQFSPIRAYIYTFNYIPRGKGKSPKFALPTGTVSKADLRSQLEEAKTQLSSIENLDKNHNIKHPYFGMLNYNMTKKFLSLHTSHHLKIAKDILKSTE